MIFELAVTLVGLVSGFVLAGKPLLLRKVSRSPRRDGKVARGITSQATEPTEPGVNSASKFKISVIVTKFADLDHLHELITRLSAQSLPADEIIVVGECEIPPSTELPNGDNIRYIHTSSKSNEGSQKDQLHHDCLAGAKASTGDLLVFLSSGVHLERDAIELMLQKAVKRPSADRTWPIQAVYVQPYDDIRKIFDHVSMFTLLANSFGKGLNKKKTDYLTDPLYPVAMVARNVYLSTTCDETTGKVATETHESNLHPAKTVDVASLTDSYLLGGQDIRFHLGDGCFHQLMQILTSSTAPNILRLPARNLALVALWLIACTTIIFELIQASMQSDAWPVLIYLALYLLTLLQLNLASRHVGGHSKSAIFFFPLWLIAFWIIFAISLVRNYIIKRPKSGN
jgi:hypothetical protein